MRDGETEYLKLLGERIRTARAQRGMTRRILARDSGVSERYLAQLEAGHGNISIALLRKVGQAMGFPLADLVRDEPEPPLELRLLVQSLARLSPQELAQARRLLGERFGALAGDRKRRVALIGLRGAGKSTLGRRLAERLDVPFLELDREIERESGLALAEIFDLYGQAAFRRHERRALETLLQQHPRAVIATGGSLVSEPATFDLLLSSCFTVWIKAAPEEHMARVVAQGDLRPMADNAESMDDLRRILAGRTALYAKADAAVDTTGRDIDTSLAELTAALG
jgi:XRE family transcriptional regulator, aerobic/anaerobic benzoate catabolism transcriptional regulator